VGTILLQGYQIVEAIDGSTGAGFDYGLDNVAILRAVLCFVEQRIFPMTDGPFCCLLSIAV